MHAGRIVFAQLIDHLPPYEFHKCVERYHGNYKLRGFSCLDQFLCLAFAQLTFRESLRDIEACLRSVPSKLYHMGFRGKVSRSTLADANEAHDWRIFADFAQVLIHIARPIYANESLGFDLDNTVYALDSTTIDLCLSVFPWARFRAHKAAIKLHTLLDLRGPIPTFIEVSEGKLHDVNILDAICPRTRFVLCDGPRLRGFPTSPCLPAGWRILRHSHQERYPVPSALLARHRHLHRTSMSRE